MIFPQYDPYTGSQASSGKDLKISPMLVHDPLGDGKSQTGTLVAPDLICPVKTVKHVRYIRLFHTNTGILNLQCR